MLRQSQCVRLHCYPPSLRIRHTRFQKVQVLGSVDKLLDGTGSDQIILMNSTQRFRPIRQGIRRRAFGLARVQLLVAKKFGGGSRDQSCTWGDQNHRHGSPRVYAAVAANHLRVLIGTKD